MRIAAITFLLIVAHCALATEQMPDVILYNGEPCELEISWEYPSPLEMYFQNSGKEYPFEMWHTANYRGHVASWELTNATLHLVAIKRETGTENLADFFPVSSDKDKVAASWFSGIAWIKTGSHKNEHKDGTYSIEYETYVFVRFNQGKVEKTITLTDKEYWDAVQEYFKRRGTDNPIQEGPIFEYSQYINSFREKVETHNQPSDRTR